MSDINRRQFVERSLIAGGSLQIMFSSKLRAEPKTSKTANTELSQLYLEVNEDNEFFFTFSNVEMGQGVLTGQATIFGEEADISPLRFKLKPAVTNGSKLDMSMTGGSNSTSSKWLPLRQAGANYRETLLTVCAKEWNVAKDELETLDGQITHKKTNRSANYSSFNRLLSKASFETNAPLKKSEDFRYIGSFNTILDAAEKVSANDRYGIDLDFDGLLNATIIRAPMFGAKLKSAKIDEIKALPGVRYIELLGKESLAIVCDKYWQCLQARSTIEAEWLEWSRPDHLKLNSKDLYQSFKEEFTKEPLTQKNNELTVSLDFEFPYLAHAPLEPQNCSAWYQGNKFEVWAPSQNPRLIFQYILDHTDLDESQVHVYCPKFLGGGFGRRGALDFAKEAIDLSYKLAKPIKVTWSREEDMTQSPLRPMSVHRFDAVINLANKSIVNWEQQVAGQSIIKDLITKQGPYFIPNWLPRWLRHFLSKRIEDTFSLFKLAPTLSSGSEQDYNFHHSCKSYAIELPIPVLFWRSVGNAHNGMAVECFLDEVCHRLQVDPLDFRLSQLNQGSQAYNVLSKLKTISGWSKAPVAKLGGQRALGVAYHFSYESYVAEVADVEVKDTQVIIHKVYTVIDCGQSINPEIIKRQVRSGIVYGLSAAFYGEINIEDGKILEDNFHQYPVIMLAECPDMEVHVIKSDSPPTGVGEPSLPPALAAVANAIFAASGVRFTKTPFKSLSLVAKFD